MTRDSIKGHLALRMVVLLCGPLALLVGGPAGVWPRVSTVALVLLLSGWGAMSTETHVLTLVDLLVVGWWGLRFGDAVPLLSVLAAALLLLAHVAAVLVGYGPVHEPMPAPVLTLWLRRGLLVLLSAPVLALTARGLRGQAVSTDVWVLGLALVVGAAVAASYLLPTAADRNG